MGIKFQILVAITLMLTNCSISFSQKTMKAMVSIENRYLNVHLDNAIKIIAQQNSPVSINQVSATLQAYNAEKQPIKIIYSDGYFFVHPDTTGWLEININLGDTIEKKVLIVKELEAVGRLGRFKANSDTKIRVDEFKAQTGIRASLECCGFDAKCSVLSFETIRINKENNVSKDINQKAVFEKKSKELVMNAKSGDIFIFRNIMYRCPGSVYPQRLDDMIFEIE